VDRLKKETENERKRAEALRDRIVYELVEEIVRDERHQSAATEEKIQ
jgi:hypothetical protein